jgi:bifunctional non-homologous end joining protein LigD
VALEEYRKKRDFTKSPEPAGDAAPSKETGPQLFFCVQKHLASHLHYDLRLEWNGVLLSWAVPKGPSIDTRDKRLAMHVEDHPIEYGSFEGVIPSGYGAGIVMLWDRGTWTPQTDDVDGALRKGELKFELGGFKLKGSWVLIRTRGYSGGRSGGEDKGNSWLLIKHKDEWAGPLDILEFAPLSVKTPDADLADILAADNPAVWTSHAPAKTGDTGKLFERIIQQALDIKEGRQPAAPSATAGTRPARQAAKTVKAAPRAGRAGKGSTGRNTAR